MGGSAAETQRIPRFDQTACTLKVRGASAHAIRAADGDDREPMPLHAGNGLADGLPGSRKSQRSPAIPAESATGERTPKEADPDSRQRIAW